MQILIDKLLINFETRGENKNIILLHGWGDNLKVFQNIIPELAKKFKVFVLDLPGFGLSSLPPRPFSVFDYAKILKKFLDKLKLDKIVLLGHSFGGRIAIKFAALFPNLVEKLILMDSAGIKPPKTFKKGLYLVLAKLGKIFFSFPFLKRFREKARKKLYQRIGVHDYEKAGELKETFLKIIDEDLQKFAQQIKAPTLIIWGENDNEVPLSDGESLNKLISNSKFVILENAGHYSFIEQKEKFLEEVGRFLEYK